MLSSWVGVTLNWDCVNWLGFIGVSPYTEEGQRLNGAKLQR